MNPLIRFASESDLPALHDLVHRAYRGDSARSGWTHEADLLDGQRTDMTALSEMLADPDQRILIAEEEKAFTGCVAISDRGGGTAYLGMLSTDPIRQGKGLGRLLMAAAEEAAAKAFGTTRMEMTVIRQRTELIAYYERRGYELTGEERPFPLDDARFGIPKRRDLSFVVLAKPIMRTCPPPAAASADRPPSTHRHRRTAR